MQMKHPNKREYELHSGIGTDRDVQIPKFLFAFLFKKLHFLTLLTLNVCTVDCAALLDMQAISGRILESQENIAL